MQTYIAFLRGINVSGQKKIIMTDLRALLTDAGLKQVQTYLQSGNVVFQSNFTTVEAAQLIESSVLKHYGFEVKTMLRTPEDLQQIVEENPFAGENTKLLYVTFLAATPTTDRLETLRNVDYRPEAFVLKDKTTYIFAANGYGKAKLNNNLFEKKLRVVATTRNWKTVNALLEMD